MAASSRCGVASPLLLRVAANNLCGRQLMGGASHRLVVGGQQEPLQHECRVCVSILYDCDGPWAPDVQSQVPGSQFKLKQEQTGPDRNLGIQVHQKSGRYRERRTAAANAKNVFGAVARMWRAFTWSACEVVCLLAVMRGRSARNQPLEVHSSYIYQHTAGCSVVFLVNSKTSL